MTTAANEIADENQHRRALPFFSILYSFFSLSFWFFSFFFFFVSLCLPLSQHPRADFITLPLCINLKSWFHLPISQPRTGPRQTTCFYTARTYTADSAPSSPPPLRRPSSQTQHNPRPWPTVRTIKLSSTNSTVGARPPSWCEHGKHSFSTSFPPNSDWTRVEMSLLRNSQSLRVN